mmetsp:Transcript_33448/g.41135  ORF Transcript_33448/g.41135 Transcript_33448/m.41135 type:complete len:154 (+) Transcript_33448:107-568(+)
MVSDARITYRKRNPYNTKRNYYRRLRTPGNRLVIQYLKKLHLKHRSLPRCGETKRPLRGVKPNRGNYKNRLLSKQQQKYKAVNRIYGGNLCGAVVKQKIIRAFLSEESRIVSKMRKIQKFRKQKKKKSGKKGRKKKQKDTSGDKKKRKKKKKI